MAAALTDVRALLAAGHQAWLGAPGGTALESGCKDQHVPFVGGFKMGRGVERVLNFRHDVLRLRALVDELHIDAVHVHRSDDQLMARMALARRKHAVLVRSWHRDPARIPKALLKRLGSACHASCCVARPHAAALRKAGASRALYLPPGVDTQKFQARSEASSDGGPPVLGIVGRMKSKEDRGHRAFLDVLKKLGAGLPWRARLLGRGEGVAEIERLVKAHPHKDRIELLDPHGDFPVQVAAIDLGFVFAAGSDGTSRPAVEFLACGVPICAADVPGLAELAEDPACGLALPLKRLDDWAAAAEKLLRDPRALQGMKAAARLRAEAAHALSVRGASLAGLYNA